MIRISRPCYDKPHRCPGRAGGGFKYAKVARCEKGMLQFLRPDGAMERFNRWRLHRCPECRVIVLPIHVEKFDPAYYRYWFFPHVVKDWWYWQKVDWDQGREAGHSACPQILLAISKPVRIRIRRRNSD